MKKTLLMFAFFVLFARPERCSAYPTIRQYIAHHRAIIDTLGKISGLYMGPLRDINGYQEMPLTNFYYRQTYQYLMFSIRASVMAGVMRRLKEG